MLSLSVKRQDFKDKLFKINNLSGRRRGFTDEIHSVRQRLTGIAVELTKKCGALRGMMQHRIGLSRTNCVPWFGVYCWVSGRYDERPNVGYVKKWITWLSIFLSCNSLWVNTFYRQSKCRLFGFHGFTNIGESARMFSFLRCEAVLLATMKPYYCKKLTLNAQVVRK